MIPNNPRSQKDIIYQERIRQARWGFNLIFTYASASVAVTLYGLVLLLAGQISKGLYTSVGGLASTAAGAYCMQLSRDANNSLDKLAARQLENQLNKPNYNVDCLENSKTKDCKNDAPKDTDGGSLTDSLEKLEQAIMKEN